VGALAAGVIPEGGCGANPAPLAGVGRGAEGYSGGEGERLGSCGRGAPGKSAVPEPKFPCCNMPCSAGCSDGAGDVGRFGLGALGMPTFGVPYGGAAAAATTAA